MDFIELTPGEMLFYGGIAGMVAVGVIAIIVLSVMVGSRKRLRRKLNDEYGDNTKVGAQGNESE